MVVVFGTSVYSNVVTNCNVGIGLSNPTALLHVNGGNTILGCNVSIGCNLGFLVIYPV